MDPRKPSPDPNPRHHHQGGEPSNLEEMDNKVKAFLAHKGKVCVPSRKSQCQLDAGLGAVPSQNTDISGGCSEKGKRLPEIPLVEDFDTEQVLWKETQPNGDDVYTFKRVLVQKPKVSYDSVLAKSADAQPKTTLPVDLVRESAEKGHITLALWRNPESSQFVAPDLAGQDTSEDWEMDVIREAFDEERFPDNIHGYLADMECYLANDQPDAPMFLNETDQQFRERLIRDPSLDWNDLIKAMADRRREQTRGPRKEQKIPAAIWS